MPSTCDTGKARDEQGVRDANPGAVDTDVPRPEMLRELLLGAPLLTGRARDASRAGATLDRTLEELALLMESAYGDAPTRCFATRCVREVARADHGPRAVACKRALLLFALHEEPELQAYFNTPFAKDLCQRVLPFVVPRFLQTQCQFPHEFVQLCMMLSEMWQGEPLGTTGDGKANAPTSGRC
jgi:hypothetical protein